MVEVLEIEHCNSTLHLYRQVWHAMFFFLQLNQYFMSQVLVAVKDREE